MWDENLNVIQTHLNVAPIAEIFLSSLDSISEWLKQYQIDSERRGTIRGRLLVSCEAFNRAKKARDTY
jgi:hypothetical protein